MTADPKEHAGRNQAEDLQKTKATPDPDNNLSRGAPSDREERIAQQEERPEHRGRSEGEAHQQWERKPEDLDREDAAIHREGIAGEKPGVRPKGDADHARDKG
jgi:hypothetical protein